MIKVSARGKLSAITPGRLQMHVRIDQPGQTGVIAKIEKRHAGRRELTRLNSVESAISNNDDTIGACCIRQAVNYAATTNRD